MLSLVSRSHPVQPKWALERSHANSKSFKFFLHTSVFLPKTRRWQTGFIITLRWAAYWLEVRSRPVVPVRWRCKQTSAREEFANEPHRCNRPFNRGKRRETAQRRRPWCRFRDRPWARLWNPTACHRSPFPAPARGRRLGVRPLTGTRSRPATQAARVHRCGPSSTPSKPICQGRLADRSGRPV